MNVIGLVAILLLIMAVLPAILIIGAAVLGLVAYLCVSGRHDMSGLTDEEQPCCDDCPHYVECAYGKGPTYCPPYDKEK